MERRSRERWVDFAMGGRMESIDGLDEEQIT